MVQQTHPTAVEAFPEPPSGPTEPRFPEAPATRAPTEPFVLSTNRSTDRLSTDRGTDRSTAYAPGSVRRTPSVAPTPSRRPALVTVAAFAAVLTVAGAATWASAQPEPAPVSAPSVAPVRLLRTAPSVGAVPPVSSGDVSSIEVATADGRAVFAVADHRWTTVPRSTTPRLMVEVDLTVSSGTLSFDPDLVKIFDARGRVYANALPADTAGMLGSGRLRTGASTRGWLGFDVPRGTTTVVLSSWRGESLGALRVTG